jgi:large subunit ribosomal protein L24
MAKPKVEPVKLKLRKGDTVMVLSGPYKGHQGRITRALPKLNKVIVDGVNVAKKHQRQTQVRIKGGIIDKEMPIPASNVAIVGKRGPTRIGYRIKDDGTKVRIDKMTGEEI